MYTLFRHHLTNIECYVLAGIALGAGFLHPFLWPLPIIGVTLWIHGVFHVRSFREAFFLGWILGIFKMGFVLLWIFSVRPEAWGWEGSPVVFALMLAGLYALVVASIALGTACVGATLHSLRGRTVFVLIMFPCFVVLSEICGALFFSLLALGPGSSVQAFFSFGHIGYTLAGHGLAHVGAHIGGVYALSYIVGLLGVGVYLASVYWGKKMGVLLFIGIIATSFIPVRIFSKDGIDGVQFLRVALVGTEISPQRSREVREDAVVQTDIRAALKEASANAELIVFPEDVRLASILGDDEVQVILQSTVTPSVLVDSTRTTDERGMTVLRASLVDASGTVASFDKQYLVPLGEFTPYLVTLFKGQNTAREKKEDGYSPGRGSEPTGITEVLFCSESIVPTFFQDGSRRGFVSHLVSHAWFKNSNILEYQSMQMVQLYAIATRSTVGVAGNFASTYLVDSRGQIQTPDTYSTFGAVTLSYYTVPISR